MSLNCTCSEDIITRLQFVRTAARGARRYRDSITVPIMSPEQYVYVCPESFLKIQVITRKSVTSLMISRAKQSIRTALIH